MLTTARQEPLGGTKARACGVKVSIATWHSSLYSNLAAIVLLAIDAQGSELVL